MSSTFSKPVVSVRSHHKHRDSSSSDSSSSSSSSKDKSGKCCKALSDESSSDSSRSMIEPRCDKKICAEEANPGLSAVEIVCRHSPAVVAITGEITITNLQKTTTQGWTNLDYAGSSTVSEDANLSTRHLQGTGFRIKGGYIVCPAALVLCPSTLVGGTGSATSGVFRYPLVSGTTASFADATVPNVMTQVSRIFVTVNSVNGGRKSFTYQATLRGVDAAGNLALLCIDHKHPYNIDSPRLEHHPYLKFGKSRECAPGQKAYLIGDYTAGNGTLYNNEGDFGVVSGTIADNRAVDNSGGVPLELVSVNVPVASPKVGSPILDKNGRVIGIQTCPSAAYVSAGTPQEVGFGSVAGVSEFAMRKPLQCLMEAHKKRKAVKHTETVADSIGNFYRYVRGYLGIAWKVANAQTFATTVNATTGFPVPRRSATDGSYLNGPRCKQLVGIQVVAVAGGPTNVYAVVPGMSGATMPGVPSNSPLLNIVSPGDIITHINGTPLGDNDHQVSPGLVMWQTKPLDNVKITYRKSSDNYATVFTQTVPAGSCPPGLDYPWSNVNIVPTFSLWGNGTKHPFIFGSGTFRNSI